MKYTRSIPIEDTFTEQTVQPTTSKISLLQNIW